MPGADDARLSRELAEAAGELLLQVRQQGGEPRALKAAGDSAAHDLLTARLAEQRPHDAVLSEEGLDDPARLRASRVWIVDPLDGTREFGEPPRTDWAVHVALWERGELVAGAVARPAAGECFGTDRPVIRTRPPGRRLRLAVSRTRPPDFVRELAARLDAELVPMGSAGVKAMSVVTGETDAYVHAGGQYEWDSAAPVAVARSAGLHTSRADGSRLEYNRPDPLLPDLLICHRDAAPDLLRLVAELTSVEGTK